LFNEENDSIAVAMVSFYEAEQVKKKLFIAIQFDSHWALAHPLGFAFKRISLRPPAQQNYPDKNLFITDC